MKASTDVIRRVVNEDDDVCLEIGACPDAMDLVELCKCVFGWTPELWAQLYDWFDDDGDSLDEWTGFRYHMDNSERRAMLYLISLAVEDE